MKMGTNSVQWHNTLKIHFRFPARTKIFLFYAPATPPTQLSIQWATGIEGPGHEADNLSMYDMALNKHREVLWSMCL